MDGDRAKPTSIRVNKNRISVTEFAERLRQSNITVESGELDDSVLLISGYDYIRKVPGYAEGLFTVQDQSSCVAVLTADIKSGDFIVDVCAAPGGKTCYAAQLTGEAGKVVARDVSEDKTELIEDNVDRLGLSNVSVQVYDARILDESLIDKADVVIADLPCSGLGIMSRKNDIKYNVTREKIKELVSLQREILDTVYKYVKPGGTLVYSTCTIDSMENGDNVKWFLENHDFKLSDSSGKGKDGYTTYIQGIDPGDGFFVAKFVRNN
jgi:16S rRNA (cytosine967-C5)-methyltransferase